MLLDRLNKDSRVEFGGLHLQSLRGSEILGVHEGLLFACEMGEGGRHSIIDVLCWKSALSVFFLNRKEIRSLGKDHMLRC